MAKDPAVLFYTSDFINGSMFFTDDQCGKYIRALCAQHQHGHLTEKQITQIVKNDIDVMEKFKVDEIGNYYNERMDIESYKRKSFCKSRRDSVAKRYEKATYVERTNIRTNVRMEDEDENENRNRNRIEDAIEEKNSIPPKIEWVQKYCSERKNSIDAQNFVDFYTSKNWLVGKNKMKDWQASIRTWEKGTKIKTNYGREQATDEEMKQQAVDFLERHKNDA
jgi:hypothetical protein